CLPAAAGGLAWGDGGCDRETGRDRGVAPRRYRRPAAARAQGALSRDGARGPARVRAHGAGAAAAHPHRLGGAAAAGAAAGADRRDRAETVILTYSGTPSYHDEARTGTAMSGRRAFSILVAASTMASLLGARGAAEAGPPRPLAVVVPFGAGAAPAPGGQFPAARLSELLGQQVVVENVGGAGGMTGAARVAKAAPDGYQLVLGGIDTFAQNQTLYKKPLYNAQSDFVPVALMVEQPLVLVAGNDLPAGNLKEFIAYARANQG